MIGYFLEVAHYLWPHAILIVVCAGLAAHARGMLVAAAWTASLVILAPLVYWLIENREAIPANPSIAKVFAFTAAGAVPLVAAAVAARITQARGRSDWHASIAGTGAGLLLLVPMPSIYLALGCLFTGVCL